jgi:3-oxoacyl-[acyl-carrier protein] reductase
MDLGFKDASAVVVGGGRGMGLATARCLADDGARVALVGRTESVLLGAAKSLTDRGSPDAIGLVADTTDAGQVQRAFDDLSQRWGGELNVLINAVGPGTQGRSKT